MYGQILVRVLGGAAQVEAETQDWFFADVFEGKFAETVPHEVVEDPHRAQVAAFS